MRIWVLLGVAGAGVGLGLLLRPSGPDPSRADRAEPEPVGTVEARPGAPFGSDVAAEIRVAPSTPASQKALAAFARAQEARGIAAILSRHYGPSASH